MTTVTPQKNYHVSNIRKLGTESRKETDQLEGLNFTECCGYQLKCNMTHREMRRPLVLQFPLLAQGSIL